MSAGLGDEEEEEGMRARGQGADDFQGLREYQPGDSKRRLDWKAYSRGQGLLVKDFAMLSGRDLWLDFDSLGATAKCVCRCSATGCCNLPSGNRRSACNCLGR